MNVKELADSTSGPVRAALLALEAKVMMLELDLAESVEQHEAFRQEVSDAVANWKDMSDFSSFETMLKLAEQDLFGFIIPAPKPDPLVEVFAECDDGTWETKAEYADKFRAALKARGLEIREKNDDQ